MYREPVSSTSIAEIGYDDGRKILVVAFVSGSIYRYRGVSEDVFEDFRAAPSKGAFFNEHIKGAYQFEQIR